MPAFTFTSPEGKQYTVNGPDGSTKEQAFAVLQQQMSGGAPKTAQISPEMDAYLTQREGRQKATEADPNATHPTNEGTIGAGEALLHYGSGMLAKVAGDVVGLGSMATNAVGLTKTDPTKQKQVVQDALTYEPRTAVAQTVVRSPINPVNIAGNIVNATGNAVGDAIKGDGSSAIRTGIGDAAAEATKQAAGFVGVKGAPVAGLVVKRGANALVDALSPVAQATKSAQKLAGASSNKIVAALESDVPALPGAPVTAREKIAQANMDSEANAGKVAPVTIKSSAEKVEIPAIAGGPTGDRFTYTAHDASGKEVGKVSFNKYDDGTVVPEHVEVDPAMRRKGVATALYDQAHKDGLNIVTSDHQSPAGKAFTDARAAAQPAPQAERFGGQLVRLQDELAASKDTPTDAQNALNTANLRQEIARKDAISTVAKTPDELTAADRARSAAADPLYKAARQSVGGVDTREAFNLIDDTMNRNIGNERLVSELGAIRKSLKAAGGDAEKVSSVLDSVKERLANQDNKFIKGSLTAVKDRLTQDIPGMSQAQAKFAEMSGPVNRMQIGQTLENKLTGPRGEERGGQFTAAVRDAPTTIKKSTGAPRYTGLDKILTAPENAAVQGVAQDLTRDSYASRMAKETSGSGSITEPAQIPHFLSSTATVANAVMKRLGHNIDAKTRAVYADWMLNPNKLAAALKQPARTPIRMAANKLWQAMNDSGALVGATQGGSNDD